jgi:hypothetical protein
MAASAANVGTVPTISANAAAAAKRVFRMVLNPYVLRHLRAFALTTHAQRFSRLFVPRYIFDAR